MSSEHSKCDIDGIRHFRIASTTQISQNHYADNVDSLRGFIGVAVVLRSITRAVLTDNRRVAGLTPLPFRHRSLNHLTYCRPAE